MDSFCESDLFLNNFQECRTDDFYCVVRFETIEGAERCIISLRRYRNLHPTFSKVHIYLFYFRNLC